MVVTFDEAPTDENLASAHIAFVESEMICRMNPRCIKMNMKKVVKIKRRS